MSGKEELISHLEQQKSEMKQTITKHESVIAQLQSSVETNDKSYKRFVHRLSVYLNIQYKLN